MSRALADTSALAGPPCGRCRHEKDVFYALVCRTVLGHSVRTQGTDAVLNRTTNRREVHLDTYRSSDEPEKPVFAGRTHRQLANVSGLRPEDSIEHHSLVAETGVAM